MSEARLFTRVPIALEFPEAMRNAVSYVLDGEYESGHDGSGLTILDIGANVGSFALWALRRWPGSVIHCYEPNPDTFSLLERNTNALSSVQRVNAAVFPAPNSGKADFFARFAGDGEAGLLAYAGHTFEDRVVKVTHRVDVVDPSLLPCADIIKLDIEGGEAEVLERMDLSGASLVLAEFQNARSRHRLQKVLYAAGFVVVRDEACPWDPILDYRDYRRDLEGDVYGHMFYERDGQTRLTRANTR